MSEKARPASLSRRDFLKAGVAATAAVGLGGAGRFVPKVTGRARAAKKLLVLGMDGMDHGLVQGWLGQVKLPAFQKVLREGGGFRPLGTSIPPQSPVAWSNFITGTDPGGHGIFDFIHRDPKAYFPIFSATESSNATRTIRLGKTIIPLSAG